MALCDEQPRSINTLSLDPMSSYAARTRSGGTCLSCAPAIINVGVFMPPIMALLKPHVVVEGARRTPVPHLAPAGSDAIMSAHTTSRTLGSNWFSQPTWRSQFASNSLRDCVL